MGRSAEGTHMGSMQPPGGGDQRRRGMALFVGLALAGLTACSADTTEPEVETEDEVVASAEVLAEGVLLSSYDDNTGEWTNSLSVNVGEESEHLTIRFRNTAGHVIERGAGTGLGVLVADESIAGFLGDAGGAFSGHLLGVSEGSTRITFIILHGHGTGSEPHPHFFTTSVGVDVIP